MDVLGIRTETGASPGKDLVTYLEDTFRIGVVRGLPQEGGKDNCALAGTRSPLPSLSISHSGRLRRRFGQGQPNFDAVLCGRHEELLDLHFIEG